MRHVNLRRTAEVYAPGNAEGDMNMLALHAPGRPAWRRARATAEAWERLASMLAALLLVAAAAKPWLAAETAPAEAKAPEQVAHAGAAASGEAWRSREHVVSGYVAQPFYRPADVHLQRPDGTSLTLHGMGFDGDALHPPIDGGLRSVSWQGSAGLMVDFLHNKAVARLGRGAHGRRLANPVVETVPASGTIAGRPAPEAILLTDLFQRLEFTHGHNVLLLTPLVRLPSLFPGVRPYLGAGGGLALPHVEVWSPGDPHEQRTSEYQLAGPAAQLVAGLDIRVGRLAWFVEYKLSWARIDGALTGGQSWLNFDLPGDLWRQSQRWWRGEAPRLGQLRTALAAQQVAAGVGWRIGALASPASP